MGYERYLKLAVTNFTDDNKDKLEEFLQSKSSVDGCKEEQHFCFNQYTKCSDFVNIKRLSKLFPNVTFYCVYVGEEISDNGYVMFHRGESMPSAEGQDFKLDIGNHIKDLMSRITNLYDEIKKEGDDANLSLHRELEETETELDGRRIEMLSAFINRRDLEDISDLFPF